MKHELDIIKTEINDIKRRLIHLESLAGTSTGDWTPQQKVIMEQMRNEVHEILHDIRNALTVLTNLVKAIRP